MNAKNCNQIYRRKIYGIMPICQRDRLHFISDRYECIFECEWILKSSKFGQIGWPFIFIVEYMKVVESMIWQIETENCISVSVRCLHVCHLQEQYCRRPMDWSLSWAQTKMNKWEEKNTAWSIVNLSSCR